jgi:hypothetical protein
LPSCLRIPDKKEIMAGQNPRNQSETMPQPSAEDIKSLKQMALTDEDTERRAASIDALSQIAMLVKSPGLTADIYGTISEAFKDSSPVVRRVAVNRLKGLVLTDGADPVRTMTLLAPMMQDPDVNVRSDASGGIVEILRDSLSKIEISQALSLRQLFEQQAEGKAGRKHRELLSGVHDVIDVFDFIRQLADASRDNTKPKAQAEAIEKLAIFTGSAPAKDPVKTIQYLAPLLQDERPFIQGWATFNATELAMAYGKRMRPADITKLRDIFTSQVNAAHFWERTVIHSNRAVIKALDNAKGKLGPQP